MQPAVWTTWQWAIGNLFADYSQGRVKAFYSGAPEPTALGQRGAGHVAYVELGENVVKVGPERVGTVTTEEVTLNVEGRNGAEIVQAVIQGADPELMLRVTLTVLTRLGSVLDVGALESELAPHFDHISCVDESHPQLETISDDDYPGEMVIGKFIRLMQERVEQAVDADDRRRAEQALQVGVALLEGKEVV